MNAKHLIACLCLVMVASIVKAGGEPQPFSLKGKIAGENNRYIYLHYTGADGKWIIDSALIKKGSFRFNGRLAHPVMGTMYLDRENARYGKGTAMFFIEPGELKMKLTSGEIENAELTGSKTNDEYRELRKLQADSHEKLKPINEQYNQLNTEYIEAKRSKKDSATLAGYMEKLENLREQMNPFTERLGEIENEFIASHPNSYVSAYLLRYRVNSYSLEKGQSLFDRFAEPLKQSSYGREILAELKSLKMGSPGSVAHLFTKTDINGEQLNLADYKGKYVLLDFWASWCVPCRKGNPHLVTLYKQYKNRGLEIVGISDDDRNHNAWKKAVEQDGIGIWKHVLRGLDMDKKMKGEENPDDLSDYYGISTLPTKILINREGVIIGRYGSEEAELDAKLAEVLPAKTVMNLNAHIRGLKDSVVHISYFEGNVPKGITVRVENEKFHWSTIINEPQKIMVGTSQRYMELFAENGDIQIDGEAESLYYSKVTGSNSNDEYVRYNESVSLLDSLQMDQYQLLHKTKDDKKLRAEIEKRIDSFRTVLGREEIKYIVKNPSSPVSIDMVNSKGMMGEYKSVDSLFNLLSAEAKATKAGKRIADRLEVLKRSAIGTVMKDFTMPALNGKMVKLSDFKGKYVFVDFWASWCGPCRAENPNVLKAYNNYKNKNFTVLGISLDDKADKWKEAVVKDKMPWIQVSDLKGFENAVSSYYGIQAIPTTFLIDPQGKIIAKNLRGEKLHERLAEILR